MGRVEEKGGGESVAAGGASVRQSYPRAADALHKLISIHVYRTASNEFCRSWGSFAEAFAEQALVSKKIMIEYRKMPRRRREYIFEGIDPISYLQHLLETPCGCAAAAWQPPAVFSSSLLFLSICANRGV